MRPLHGTIKGVTIVPKAGLCFTGCVAKQADMKIDDATASRLYSQCKAGAPLVKEFKESVSQERASLVIRGVPCVVDFGFSASRKIGRFRICSCAWIFGGSNQGFFASYYLPVEEDSHPASILNSTIGHAIEQVRESKKFQEQLAINSANS
jgi:hypothetical protein